jgi:uncharacterized membrane protein
LKNQTGNPCVSGPKTRISCPVKEKVNRDCEALELVTTIDCGFIDKVSSKDDQLGHILKFTKGQ